MGLYFRFPCRYMWISVWSFIKCKMSYIMYVMYRIWPSSSSCYFGCFYIHTGYVYERIKIRREGRSIKVEALDMLQLDWEEMYLLEMFTRVNQKLVLCFSWCTFSVMLILHTQVIYLVCTTQNWVITN